MYENLMCVTHYGPAGVDFGTGGSADAISFRGPKGMKGILLDVGVANITEAFAGTTTDGQVQVGIDVDVTLVIVVPKPVSLLDGGKAVVDRVPEFLTPSRLDGLDV